MTIIHKSPLPDIEIADVSITDYVLRKADELPDKPAFIDGGNGRVITFSGHRRGNFLLFIYAQYTHM